MHTGRRLVGSIIVAAALLAACARGPTEADNTGTGPVQVDFGSFKGKHLTYLYFTDGPDLDATKKAISRFELETGATVDLQVTPFADLLRSLQARVAGGTAP